MIKYDRKVEHDPKNYIYKEKYDKQYYILKIVQYVRFRNRWLINFIIAQPKLEKDFYVGLKVLLWGYNSTKRILMP